MFDLMRSLTVRDLLVREAPQLSLSFLLAEMFYKFHSFTLECIAFLVTWYVLGFVYDGVFGRAVRPAGVRD